MSIASDSGQAADIIGQVQSVVRSARDVHGFREMLEFEDDAEARDA